MLLILQVITALTKAVDAEQRKAVQFATTVDREVSNIIDVILLVKEDHKFKHTTVDLDMHICFL